MPVRPRAIPDFVSAMKKTKSTSRRRSKPTGGGPNTVDEYFADVPEAARGMLTQMRTLIRSVVPNDATEVVSYRMPAFRRNGVLVWYAAFAESAGLFPGGSVLEQFKDELAAYKTSKGTVQFPLDTKLPVALIKRIVKAGVAKRERTNRR